MSPSAQCRCFTRTWTSCHREPAHMLGCCTEISDHSLGGLARLNIASLGSELQVADQADKELCCAASCLRAFFTYYLFISSETWPG